VPRAAALLHRNNVALGCRSRKECAAIARVPPHYLVGRSGSDPGPRGVETASPDLGLCRRAVATSCRDRQAGRANSLWHVIIRAVLQRLVTQVTSRNVFGVRNGDAGKPRCSRCAPEVTWLRKPRQIASNVAWSAKIGVSYFPAATPTRGDGVGLRESLGRFPQRRGLRRRPGGQAQTRRRT
jgi:hypothetical protein